MKKDIWIALFCLGLFLFHWPLLSIFQEHSPYYLFLVWILFIGLIFLASRSADGEDGGG